MSIEIPLLPIFVSLSNLILSMLFVGKNKRKVSETAGKSIQLWGLITIGLIGISLIFVLDIQNNNVMRWFWLIFIIIVLSFQSFLEWKFTKETNRYIVSLSVLILSLFYIFIFIF
ncbi:DUF4181 domain-containing protein [Paraliobacillus salinarum]|uniref:DUF4181 domain-containing protein n=1 Tax=Paraliobacillus salinarum TaxID=1158996 RepID=UPI0015F69F0B|nr:DUF4181 domain-containing protein [Paraliobacillus salinarum]